LADALLETNLFTYNYPDDVTLLPPPKMMEHSECSEASAYKIQTSGNHSKEKLQHSEQGGSFKPSKTNCIKRLYPAIGTPVADSPNITQFSAVRGTWMHT
jgi:hypothetical protein